MNVKLATPLSESDVRSLHVGDIVFLSGTIVTARDAAHKRMIESIRSSRPLPINLKGGVIYHCGPIVKRERDRLTIVSAGPTTSMRMEPFEPFIIERLGVRMVIGKGGMGKETIKAMKRHGAVYAAFPGGAGVLAASKVSCVLRVEWEDLGMPEALWVLKVESFGPLVIAIDSHGETLYRG